MLVGPARLIAEVQALRRLMFRHTPNNNQRTVARFLALGHYDTMVHRLHRAYRARWQAMNEALTRHLPGSFEQPSFGGSSFWVHGPEGLDTEALDRRARARGVLIEPGRIFFFSENPPTNYFRLAFSSVASERIEPGIRILADLIHVRA